MQQTSQEKNQYLRAVLDAMPSLVFVVDTDLRIIDANKAAKTMLKRESGLVLKRLCGDVLHCINELQFEKPCGETERCPHCIIRLAVTTSHETDSFFRQKYRMVHQVEGVSHEADYFITASPIEGGEEKRFLLVLEDVSELLALRQLSTLCSYCSKVHNEHGEWEVVHQYLARRENLIFSHGMCPSCFTEFRLKFIA